MLGEGLKARTGTTEFAYCLLVICTLFVIEGTKYIMADYGLGGS